MVHWQAAMQKMFMTEAFQRVARTGMELLGLHGQLREDSRLAALRGEVEYYYRWSVLETIYGGTSEIQRDIIAAIRLGLTRS